MQDEKEARGKKRSTSSWLGGNLLKWFAGWMAGEPLDVRGVRPRPRRGFSLDLTVYALHGCRRVYVEQRDLFLSGGAVSYSSLNSPTYQATEQGPTRAHPSAEKSANTGRRERKRSVPASRHPLNCPLHPAAGTERRVWESVGGTIFHFPPEQTAA